ncbi:MAG TPA: hypothetical protein VHR43_13275 [Gemmatimonadales bacterium]|nr:hypothetical protein [Gemmatimonadales bacterium]
MLAYVFWHWPRPDVAADEYESAQRRFHAALAAVPPPGFRRSWSVAISGAPWTGAGAAYEDWYLLDSAAALDPLNTAAVTASRQGPHDAAAALAAGGTAGLYAARLGTPVEPPRVATWFGRPPGMSYPDLFAALAPLVGAEAGVMWLRQMVLGPSPECCLHSARPFRLPSPFTPQQLDCRTVWSG